MSRLLITNRDVEADRIPWRDPLHEGPVPRGLSLDELSRLRARFIAENLDDRPLDRVLAEFLDRDKRLMGFKRYDEVTLWFEHGLDDQLRLIQVLSWFGRRELGRTRLTLDSGRTEAERPLLDLATRAWDAFGSDRPSAMAGMAGEEPAALPFLPPAFRRHLEQFPWTRDGLSRTERQILESVRSEPADLRTVFRLSQTESEETPFLCDGAFLYHLARISGGESTLVQIVDEAGRPQKRGSTSGEEVWERRIQLTEIGRKILAGQADAVRLFGIDRWLGGVHLQGAHAAWRWDDRRGAIIPLSA